MASASGPPPPRMRQPRDFTFGRVLGEGSFASVVSATEKETNRRFAVKVVDKKFLVRENKAKYAMVEKEVLNRSNHAFIVKLFYTFQSADSLYFVMELAENGDLLALMRSRIFTREAAVFYTAEIIVGIDYLHSIGVLHRDLKPENILLSADNHIKICDFGSAKIQQPTSKPDATSPPPVETHPQQNSFVGTAEYCSPELLNDRSATTASDVWAIGCILFYMYSNRPPFKGPNEYQTFQRILALKYEFPESHLNIDEGVSEARAVVERILVLDSKLRITIPELKMMPFFKSIHNWDNLSESKAPILQKLPMDGTREKLAFSVDELSEWYGRSMNVEDDASTSNNVQQVEIDASEGSPVDSEDNFQYPYETAEAIDDDWGSHSLEGVNGVIMHVEPNQLREVALTAQKSSVLAPILENNELVVMVGTVGRRKGLFMKKMGLMLTDKPRLQFFDCDKYTPSSQIAWSGITSVTLKDNKNFVIESGKKTYNLKDLEQHADQWVSAIKKLL
ncbi:3-phosphoinositide dependent protein kinase-1 [Chytriomyces hyalinus]|nr:3-phosphoinositide dependent protein kinase-1 [Chytriomyces hyalinus]